MKTFLTKENVGRITDTAGDALERFWEWLNAFIDAHNERELINAVSDWVFEGWLEATYLKFQQEDAK